MPMSSERRPAGLVRRTPTSAPAAGRPNLTIRAGCVGRRLVDIDGERARGVRLADGSLIAAETVAVCGRDVRKPDAPAAIGDRPCGRVGGLGRRGRAPTCPASARTSPTIRPSRSAGWSGTSRSEPLLHSIAPWRSPLAGPGDAPDLLFWFADPQGDPAEFAIECVLMRPVRVASSACGLPIPTDPPRISLPG